MNSIRLLNLGLISPLQTQAMYHALAERMTVDSTDTIILCRPSAPYLCLGYHQVFENTFDKEECARRGLPVLRRRLGGGATYLDENQIFYQCIFHHSRMPAMLKDIYASTLSAPVNTLKKLGLNAELRDTNEIEVDGKRIAGTGGGRIGEACVVVGNLLFDFDFESMTSVWRTPSFSFRWLAEKALRQQLMTLDQLAITASPEEITGMLIDDFSRAFNRPVQTDTLTAEEIESANKAAQELISDEFLSLHKEREIPTPMRTLKISARAFIHAGETHVNGYDVRGSFWLSQDVIQMAKLESNPAYEWQTAEEKLCGILFKEWQEQIHAHFSNETILS
ncbi:MAG: biotin/lipoate A/B protein ligase family protein [Anaerolineales bacterium]|jgi:lipoate-protein ligase A|nr:biotin/lipoate A/B protein ligase family protein [Anaerolineales bacterium]